MSSRKGRTVFGYVWHHFCNSLKPRQRHGNLMGEDYFGNKYFEKPADRSIGKQRAERWFEPSGDPDAIDREMTGEWESWLRGRR